MLLEQPQSIRTIFFDAGFTLLHPNPSTAEICQLICRQLDLHIHLDKLQGRIAEADDFFYRQTRKQRHMWASEDAINAFWIEYYMKFLRPFVEEHDEPRLYQLARMITQEFEQHTSWQIYPDAPPTLDALKAKNYTLGVISDWGIGLGRILHKLHLNKYFDSLVVRPGSSRQALSLALRTGATASQQYRRLYLAYRRCYILDVLGARSVGITPILLDRRRQLQVNNVDCILIDSLTEIIDMLEVD